MRTPILSTVTLLALAGCAMNPAPVAISADPEGQALILGDWSGTYYTSDGARAGSIVFQFHKHDSTGIECNGDVVMTLPAHAQPAKLDETGVIAPEEILRLLQIDFVDVRGRDVTGDMVPYRDPDTDEMLNTTFRGRIEGDRITGRLLTVHEQSKREDVGTWEIFRGKK